MVFYKPTPVFTECPALLLSSLLPGIMAIAKADRREMGFQDGGSFTRLLKRGRKKHC